MELGELRDFLAPESLVLRIAGESYEIKAPNAEQWLKLQTAKADFIAQGADWDLQLGAFWDLALGETAQQMYEHGARSTEINHAAWTAFYWKLGLDDAARQHWAGGPSDSDEGELDPEGKSSAPAATKKKATPTRSRRTAGARTTR